MSCGVISDCFLVTPGLRWAPSRFANARRPAAVRPPFGSFSRGLADFAVAFRETFFGDFLSATRLRPARFAVRFLADFFFVAFFVDLAAMCMLSTRLG